MKVKAEFEIRMNTIGMLLHHHAAVGMIRHCHKILYISLNERFVNQKLYSNRHNFGSLCFDCLYIEISLHFTIIYIYFNYFYLS